MKTQSLQLSLISGAVGVMLGAGSMYVVDASIIQRGRVHSAAEQVGRPGIRSIQEEGKENVESETGKRAGVVYPTSAIR